MGKCLDFKNCGFENRDKAHFCANCGIPIKGTFLHGRYEIQSFMDRNHGTMTLGALDRQSGYPVVVRALMPKDTNEQNREDFLQEAELAASLSASVHDPESVRVVDYGQEGPLTFLIKSRFAEPQSNTPLQTITGVDRQSFLPEEAVSSASTNEENTLLRIPIASEATDHQAYPSLEPASLHTPIPTEQNWLQEGHRAFEQGNYREALAAYEIAIQQDTTSIDAGSITALSGTTRRGSTGV